MFENAKRVARWSVIAGLINTAACARCFFVHEYLVGTWCMLLAVAMVGQFYIASLDAETEASVEPRLRVAWYRGDDYACWKCGHVDPNAGQLSACPACGSPEGPTDLPRI